jgi:ABC-type phosphate transport system substrate-binding protein
MRKSTTILLLSWLVGAVMVQVSLAQKQDVAVVVNTKSSVTNVSSSDLRKIFAGEKRTWPGGTPIKIIVRPPGCHERQVLLRLLGMTESEYKQYWTVQVFRGEADAEPLSVPSFGMVMEAARAFPGAIGLADAQNVKPGMDLKVIKVDKLMPGNAGYPVH